MCSSLEVVQVEVLEEKIPPQQQLNAVEGVVEEADI
jgi:hypothetical protein